MLEISIPKQELFDNISGKFINIDRDINLRLEHSLISLSKWESKWKKAYLTEEVKNYLQSIDYVRCMAISKGINPDYYFALTVKDMETINKYINDPMTATTITKNDQSTKKKETITSELIYYYMIQFQIPFECEKWHLNRLLTLIEVCGVKGAPEKKMAMKDVYARNKAINEANRKKFKTRG